MWSVLIPSLIHLDLSGRLLQVSPTSEKSLTPDQPMCESRQTRLGAQPTLGLLFHLKQTGEQKDLLCQAGRRPCLHIQGETGVHTGYDHNKN